jgi:hypothetical protein
MCSIVQSNIVCCFTSNRQAQGVEHLLTAVRACRPVIFADTTGLGKSVQILAFLTKLTRNSDGAGVLVHLKLMIDHRIGI